MLAAILELRRRRNEQAFWSVHQLVGKDELIRDEAARSRASCDAPAAFFGSS
jgi:hypothetical protein